LIGLPRDLQLFLAATFVFGFSQSIVDSTFNNYLNETFTISDFQRGFLELPRELPGFFSCLCFGFTLLPLFPAAGGFG